MEIMIPSAGFCYCSGDLELCIISYGCFNTWRPLYKVPFIAVLLRSMHPTEGCQRVLIEVILTLTFCPSTRKTKHRTTDAVFN